MKNYILYVGTLLSVVGCSETQTTATAETSKPAVGEPSASSKPSSKPSMKTSGLTLGASMPSAAVKMQNVDGRMVTLGEIAGEKGTLVIFTCNHCPYAKAWEARYTEIGNEFMEKGIGVVAVNPNDPSVKEEDGFEEMQARAKKLGMRYPYVVDATSDVARAYGATKTPEVFLFDGKKQLVYRGAVDDDAKDPDGVESPYLRDALTALLEGRPIERPETKAVGCSIKLRPGA